MDIPLVQRTELSKKLGRHEPAGIEEDEPGHYRRDGKEELPCDREDQRCEEEGRDSGLS